MGMTWCQFWEDDPKLAAWYRKADDMRRRRKNQELWLEGVYMMNALSATVGNMFSKGSKHQYPEEPLAITVEEQAERREREEKARMERIKARFMVRALNVNKKLGGIRMDQAEKRARLSELLSPDTASDEVLDSVIELADAEVLNRMYPFGYPDGTVVPFRYERLALQLAVELYSKRGAEGQTGHSENGISRTWPEKAAILARIAPHVGSVTSNA